mgnify:CR=1 FL=1
MLCGHPTHRIARELHALFGDTNASDVRDPLEALLGGADVRLAKARPARPVACAWHARHAMQRWAPVKEDIGACVIGALQRLVDV